MNVTYGPSTGDLSGTETLQSCLESRLRARLEGTGSTMFQTTLKHWVTKSGRRIFAQRARAVRISGAGFGSWPTPTVQDAKHASVSPSQENRHSGNLVIEVGLAAWPTPCVPNGGRVSSNKHDMNKHQDGTKAQIGLENAVRLAAWATPTTRDHKDGTSDGTAAVNALLGRQTWLTGWPTPRSIDGEKGARTQSGVEAEVARKGHLDELPSVASLSSWPAVPDAMDAALLLNLVPDLLSLMDSGATQVGFYADRSGVVVISVGGPLNPEHSRWLMGYPAELGCCGATAMQSIRTSRRGSSKRTAKREI